MRQTVALKDAKRHLAVAIEHLDAGLTFDHPLVQRALRLAVTNLQLVARGVAK